MKISCFSATKVIAALLAAIVAGVSQTVETPIKPLTEIAPTNPVRTPLSATILPVDNSSKASGGLLFIPVGDEVRMFGQIAGLETDRRYEIVLLRATAAGPPPLSASSSPPAGRPGGNVPASGVAGAVHSTPGQELGMWVADAKGILGVDTNIPKYVIDKYPEGFTGCTILIKRAPPLDTESERPTIAYGLLTSTPSTPPPKR
jgi:hypothetical protein